MTLWRDCPMDWHKKRYGVCPDCYIRYVVPVALDREQIHDAITQAIFPTGTGDSYDGADAVIALLTGEGDADD